MSIHLDGFCDPAFVDVRRAFADNFSQRGEIGAGVSIFVDGKNVVNLWGGRTHWFRAKKWHENSLVNIYSGSKGITAICALRLVDQGLLDLDKPVAHYWPEFAKKGKGEIPVKWILNHKAGVSGVRRPLMGNDLYRWKKMSRSLASQSPWWEPGEKHGYHAASFGWIMGEIIKSITGKTVGEYLKQEICDPLGLDLHFGVAQDQHDRIAPIILPVAIPESKHTWNLLASGIKNPFGPTTSAILNPITIATGVNSKRWRNSELPAINAHSTAHALAKLYGVLARGGELGDYQLISDKTLDLAIDESSAGHDYVLKMDTRFSMGFMLNQSYKAGWFGDGKRSFGHNGAGGSFAFADPDAKIGFGYVMNRMGTHLLLDPRAQHLIEAVYRCL